LLVADGVANSTIGKPGRLHKFCQIVGKKWQALTGGNGHGGNMAAITNTERHFPTDWESSPDNARIPATVRRGTRARITILWQAAANFVVPTGYEDNAGFHYGEKPAPLAVESPGGQPFGI
jgi:hypothetical protein